MKCSNCKADVDKSSDRCPHCNTMLYVGIIALAVIFLVITVLLIHQRKVLDEQRKEKIKNEQVEQERLIWENDVFLKLDSWYEAGDYGAIIDFQDSIYAGNGGYDIQRWRHYSFIVIYNYYEGVVKLQNQIIQKQPIKNYQIGGALYDAMNLWYGCTEEKLKDQIPEDQENATWGLTIPELSLIEQYRDEAWKFMTVQLHMSSEEIESLYQSCQTQGYVGACYDYAESKTWEVEQ